MIKINKFFIPYVIFLLIIGYKGKLFLAFLIAFIHELVHYIAARLLGYSGYYIEFLPVGTVIKVKDLEEASAKEDIIISISGPVANLILGIMFYFLTLKYQNDTLILLFQGNIALGLFNLIPALPLDGGRILRDIITSRTIYKKANIIAIKWSISIGILLMVYYIFLFLHHKGNITIAIISIFIIISSIKERERIAYIIMGDIIKKRYKFMKRGYIENKSISIYFKDDLLLALSVIDKNKYNIFTVLDDEMKVIDIVYEEEIIDTLKKHGNITFEEFIRMRDENVF